MFSDNLFTVAVCLIVTAILLYLSDISGRRKKAAPEEGSVARNGISYWQALTVGLSQAVAVAPGLSRSGTTIATGLLCGVRREVMAQFSFLMVLVPIIGEQFLDLVKSLTGDAVLGGGLSPVCLVTGFLAAFLSGLFACKVMIAIVRKARLTWFAIYCLVVSLLLLVFA